MASKDAQVVVVTGASAGVGRAVVRRFAAEGASIALIARAPDRLDAAAGEVEAAGGRALILPLDVADSEAVEKAAEEAEEKLGPIDVWVNNAMVTVFATVAETSPEEFRRTTEVNYLGSVWGTMAALRRMRPRNRGTIVQVGSALAYRGIPLQGPYCGAKHALQGFLDSLRAELLHEGSKVRVTAVHLPAVNTPQFSWGRTKLSREPRPVPPIFQPEVAAEAVVWAARNPRRELWVGWSTVKAIVGNKIASGLVDHYLAGKAFDAQQTDDPVRPAGWTICSSRLQEISRPTVDSKNTRSPAAPSSGRRHIAAGWSGAPPRPQRWSGGRGTRSARRLRQAPADEGCDRATYSSVRRRR